jgi:phosphoglycolate phosphatase-like HAD superfamily hydrolase
MEGKMRKKITILFDLSGTLVKMRPAKLLINRNLLKSLFLKASLGIITGAKKTETLNILSKLNIAQFFDYLITKDDSRYKKPNKKLIENVSRRLRSKRIIYIGDAKSDYLLAKNSNVKFFYVGKRKYGIYQNCDINEVAKFIVKSILK